MAPPAHFGLATAPNVEKPVPSAANMPSKTGAMSKVFGSPEMAARSSFSSVRENDDGLAQTFTHSNVSSYTQGPEDVFDESPTSEIAQPVFRPPLTRPTSRLHGFLYPAESFRGWKAIPVRGKTASRSFEDLNQLYIEWDSPAPAVKRSPSAYPAAKSPLESLPREIIGAIIDLLVVELPPSGLSSRNTDLAALLITSRTMHAATLDTLYRHVTIPHSRIFRKFLATITEYPALASIIRRLDFSHFNPSTMFSTASERAQTRNLTSETLARCLELTPHLQEFLAQEYIDEDLSVDVLRKLLFDLPQLKAVDFCGCSSPPFKNAFTSLLSEPWPDNLPITRISFHKCLSLPSSVFEKILPRMGRMTHLDAAGTRITDEALMSIPETARLTHLNLARCKELSASAVIEFITSHPAAMHSLAYLSLATDPTTHLLFNSDNVTELLPQLPATLRSLSLKGSRMDASHVPQLRTLVQNLEELAVGRGFTMSDVHDVFFDKDGDALPHNLRYLDISDVDTIVGTASSLFAPALAPLHVIELSQRAFDRANKNKKAIEAVGWTTKEFGCRFWLVRLNPDGTTRDNGGRWWKMGAENWGMRKVPVAQAEVGGMYGSFMFGRRL
jgi:hypothetical protein